MFCYNKLMKFIQGIILSSYLILYQAVALHRPDSSSHTRLHGAQGYEVCQLAFKGGSKDTPIRIEQIGGGVHVGTSHSFTTGLHEESNSTHQRDERVRNLGIRHYNPLRMYLTCVGIVLVWILVGTTFYSYCNTWPLAQSFFYAVDAGMSIGFCTQVRETNLVSKAFTILYILLGASVVSGTLALFVEDVMAGLSNPTVEEYQVLLERRIFDRADIDQSGVLTFEQFQALVQSSFRNIPSEDIYKLWKKFDRLRDGVIHFEEFSGRFRGISHHIEALRENGSVSFFNRVLSLLRDWLFQAWQVGNRVYCVFLLWILIGITWGIRYQQWDLITATHFAVSALATGGLTAPDVNADGVLPSSSAIFCGFYCLFGIPLFALTLGHFARVLVSDHVAALERTALSRPLSKDDYDLAALLTTKDSVVHLGDYIVLHLLRQGKISMDTIEVLKQNFEMLDVDSSGTLSLEQATCTSQPRVD